MSKKVKNVLCYKTMTRISCKWHLVGKWGHNVIMGIEIKVLSSDGGI